MEQKTEKPTPKKIRDARKKGQVAQSKEIVSAATIMIMFAWLWAMGEYYQLQLMAMMELPTYFYNVPFRQALTSVMQTLFTQSALLLLPILGLTFITAVAANYIQVGSLFVFEPIKPELKKISPLAGAKKIFSVKNLVEFIKSIVKIVFLSLLIYKIIIDNIDTFFKIPHCGLSCISPFMAHLFQRIFIYSSIAFIIIAAIDYFFQKSQHIKQLKMSKDEVRREHKDMEGDPEIKSKRKSIHREMMQEDIPKQVKQSSVVITNPTHIAVGLHYDKNKQSLPLITIKGEDLLARRIKEIAIANGIPVMENVPLARALNETGEAKCSIPSDLIEPVAQVLKWVEHLESNKHSQ